MVKKSWIISLLFCPFLLCVPPKTETHRSQKFTSSRYFFFSLSPFVAYFLVQHFSLSLSTLQVSRHTGMGQQRFFVYICAAAEAMRSQLWVEFLASIKISCYGCWQCKFTERKKGEAVCNAPEKKSLKKMYNSRAMWQMVRMEHWRSSRALIAQTGRHKRKIKSKILLICHFSFLFSCSVTLFSSSLNALFSHSTNDRMSLDY